MTNDSKYAEVVLERPDRTETETQGPLPEVLQTAIESPAKVRNFAITGLFVLAIFYTLYFAADFVLPVALAVLMSLLLLPMVSLLTKAKIPEAIGSGVSIVILILVLTGLASLIYQPATTFLQDFPHHLRQIHERLSFLSGPLKQAGHTSDQVEELMGSSQNSSTVVTLKSPGVVQGLFSQTPVFSSKLIVVIILAYFLLAHREAFLLKAVKAVPTFQDKRRVVEIAKEVQTSIAKYLVSVTLLNLGLGISVGLAVGLLGLANPLMWGVAAFLLNFVPFVGAVCGIVLIAMASLVQFDNIWYACLAPSIYLVLNAMESNFVTPQFLGKWMTLNPVAIFLSFLFWGWIWGVAGMLLAVPILAIVKIFCDRVDSLAQLGEFLGD